MKEDLLFAAYRNFKREQIDPPRRYSVPCAWPTGCLTEIAINADRLYCRYHARLMLEAKSQ